MAGSDYLQLLDWRRRVAALFAGVRERPADGTTATWFRSAKDVLFRDHPQSPLPPGERSSFTGLPYWPYDAAARVVATLVPEPAPARAASGRPTPGEVPFFRIGRLDFILGSVAMSLGAYWIDGYAGGLFVPFTDATSGQKSYGGGRYLLDTIKSADFGSEGGPDSVVLDFNYAYHPSCAYDPRWVCPLAPADNRLAVAVEAGEQSR